MSDDIVCQVVAHGNWEGINIFLALKMPKTRIKRCIECHGRVRPHSTGSNGMKAHIEHFERHRGCSRGDCFDGSSRPHPVALK